MGDKTFFELYEDGKLSISDVKKYVQEWEKNFSTKICLFKYLGLE